MLVVGRDRLVGARSCLCGHYRPIYRQIIYHPWRKPARPSPGLDSENDRLDGRNQPPLPRLRRLGTAGFVAISWVGYAHNGSFIDRGLTPDNRGLTRVQSCMGP